MSHDAAPGGGSADASSDRDGAAVALADGGDAARDSGTVTGGVGDADVPREADAGGDVGVEDGGADDGGEGRDAEGGSDAARPDCSVRVPPPDPTWPAWGQRDNCAVCFPETCEWYGYTGGSFIDSCGIFRRCGPEPTSFGQSPNCPPQQATLWSVGGGGKFPNPDARCVSGGTFACCPSSLTTFVTPDTGANLVPLNITVNTSCAVLTTYYLDHDYDGVGGPITVDACYPPDAIPPGSATPFVSGVWVTETGDCNEGPVQGYVVGTFEGAFFPSWLPVPSYDWDCDGVEEPRLMDEWLGADVTCMSSASCSGPNSSARNGNRSASGYPGINDLCGGQAYACMVIGNNPYGGYFCDRYVVGVNECR